MTLYWTLRLLCVLAVAAGIVLAISQIVLALAARWILRRLDAITARWRERILYLLQIGPALLAAFVAAALCLPAYLRGETNLESERVSALCLLLAVVIVVGFAFSFLGGLRISLRTIRITRACRRSGRLIAHHGGIPVLAVHDSGPPVRLIGFFRPLILVSASPAFAPGTFDLALAHERSHATHRDNWKLLTLSFLPRFDRLLPGGDPWSRPWQQAADWAADDDAVQSDSVRSVLLAEALVTAARAANSIQASRAYVCSALTADDAGLAARVDRLIHPRPGAHPSSSSVILALAAIVVSAAIGACALSPWIYTLSERLLHL